MREGGRGGSRLNIDRAIRGRPLDSAFAEFDPEPIAAASLGLAAEGESPDPNDESPPIPSAIRIREHDEPYAGRLTGPSSSPSPGC